VKSLPPQCGGGPPSLLASLWAAPGQPQLSVTGYDYSQMRPGTPEFRNAQQYFGLGGRFNPAAWQAFMIAGPYSTNVEDRRDEPPPPMEEVVAAWKNWDNKWKDVGSGGGR
jgi:hypothetical protein